MRIIQVKLLIIFIFALILLTILSIPGDLQLGEIYFDSYEYEKALKYFQKSEDLKKAKPNALIKLKKYYLTQGNIKQALKYQKLISEKLPHNQEQLKNLIQLYEWDNKVYQSLQTQEKLALLQNDTNKREKDLTQIVIGYRWLKKYSDADRVASKLAETNKKDYLISNLEYYSSTNNFNKVIETTKQLKDLGMTTRNFLLLQAKSYEIQKKYKQSIIAYKNYLLSENGKKNIDYENNKIVLNSDFYHDNLNIFEKIINLYYRYGDTDQLVDLYLEILKVIPDEYEIGFDAISLLYKKRRYKDIKFILKDNCKSDKPKIIYRTSDIYTLIKNYPEAISCLEKLTKIKPLNIDYLELLAEAYENNKEYKKALKLRYKIYSIQERKIKKNNTKHESSFFNEYNSDLYAFNQKETLYINKHRDNLKLNHQKIINLLEKSGQKRKLYIELEKYTTNYPLDTEYLAFFASLAQYYNDNEKAKKAYENLFKLNPLNKDALLFQVEKYLEIKNYKEAKNLIDRYKKVHPAEDIDIINKEEQIYRVLDIKKANDLCENFLKHYKNKTDYTSLEITTRCYIAKENYSKAINIIHKKIKKNPDDKNPKILLAYIYLKTKDIYKAKIIINKLIQDNKIEGSTKKELLNYYEDSLQEQRILNAWLYNTSGLYNKNSLFKNDNWLFRNKLLKRFNKHSLFFSHELQKPAFISKKLENLGFGYSYKDEEKYQAEFIVGKNMILDNDLYLDISFENYFSKQKTLFLKLDYNKQRYNFYDINSDENPTQDNLSIGFSNEFSQRHAIFANINISSIMLNTRKNKSLYTDLIFTWDFSITHNFYIGPYLYELKSLKEDERINQLLNSKVSIQALHLKYYPHIFNNSRLTNHFDFYIGQVSNINSDIPNYFRISNTSNYRIKDQYSLYLIIEESKQFTYREEFKALSLEIGMSKWIY